MHKSIAKIGTVPKTSYTVIVIRSQNSIHQRPVEFQSISMNSLKTWRRRGARCNSAVTVSANDYSEQTNCKISIRMSSGYGDVFGFILMRAEAAGSGGSTEGGREP
ncbi:hypothetical protein EVAR_26827_1 [Eumeta japonica]|uniref:Uncharacterized protein n=1 Tax=Eumeta variegata TaxID=151549 RepID=A0A4C1VWJ4_EUMVA|nr:hypothetical protein EVAR_26827_1 [Eumeta japonica]